MQGAEEYNFYVNGKNIGSTAGLAYNVPAAIFAKAGEYKVQVAAVDEEGLEGARATINFISVGNDETMSETKQPEEPSTTTAKSETTEMKQFEEASTTYIQGEIIETTSVKEQTTLKKTQSIKRLKRTKIKKATGTLKTKVLKLKLKKIKGALGYQFRVYKSKKSKKAVWKKTLRKNQATVILKFKKIAKYKMLYIKARAYTWWNETKIYGKWSNVKKVKVK